jgi:hypothetical protein
MRTGDGHLVFRSKQMIHRAWTRRRRLCGSRAGELNQLTESEHSHEPRHRASFWLANRLPDPRAKCRDGAHALLANGG